MKKLTSIILALILIGLVSGVTLAATPIIAVDELRPGMQGIAKTVIRGADIETFNVEILGVTGSQAEGHSILVRASGDVIERSGGIAQGMSGSPVYIDGRLAGAVAYGKAFSDPTYCFLTPIEEMLRMFEERNPRPSEFIPKNSPLMVSGFSAAGLSYLTEKLAPFNLQPFAVPTGQHSVTGITLEPGSSVGVELARGDVRLGAIGTVTWLDDKGRVLAFGHPFLQSGDADYFMTNAWIFASIPNVESSYKVGALGEVVGAVKQDRAAGIAGQLGAMPQIIPLFVAVTDTARGLHKSAEVQLITAETLVPSLVDGICYNTVNQASDRKGAGTAKVNFRIAARGAEQGELVLERENMFYHAKDVAKIATAELAYATDLLMNNKFEKTTIFDINVNVEITDSVELAEIVKASTKTGVVKPGDKILVEVEFQPYRSKKITKTVEFKIPSDSKEGPLTLLVRGGGAFSWMQTLLKKQQADG
ncbi:MAG: SpoIVB peptidase S55 domain-containing protein [Acidaminococcaceae bacterium]